MNKKFVYQVGNNKKLYYDARPTKYQDQQNVVHIPGKKKKKRKKLSTAVSPVLHQAYYSISAWKSRHRG